MLAGVEFCGAIGCDIAKGGRALMGSRGGEGTEEGGGCRRTRKEPSSEHVV